MTTATGSLSRRDSSRSTPLAGYQPDAPAGMPYPVLDTTDKRILKVLGCGRPGQKSKPLSIRGLDGQFHELTDTHRELFRLLLRRSGQRGCTWLRQAGDDSMATALGWCRRKVCRIYAELADMGVIYGQRRGTRKRKPDEEGRGAVGWANRTFVLLHPLLATAGIGERCAAAPPPTGPKIDVHVSGVDVHVSGVDVLAHPVKQLKKNDLNLSPKSFPESFPESKAAQENLQVVAEQPPPPKQQPVEALVPENLFAQVQQAQQAAGLPVFTSRGDRILRTLTQRAREQAKLLPRWIHHETQRPRSIPVAQNSYFVHPAVLDRMDSWLIAPKDPPQPQPGATPSLATREAVTELFGCSCPDIERHIARQPDPDALIQWLQQERARSGGLSVNFARQQLGLRR